jgi:hypothetical protein
MPVSRQRLGKHIPEVTLSTIEGHPSLGNALLITKDGVFRGVRAEELQGGTVTRTERELK